MYIVYSVLVFDYTHLYIVNYTECQPLTSFVSPEYDVDEDVSMYVKRALRQAQHQE